MNKQQASEHITALLNKIHADAQDASASLLGSGNNKYVDLAKRCANIEEKVAHTAEVDGCLIIDDKPVREVIIDLEIEHASAHAKMKRITAIWTTAVTILTFILAYNYGNDIDNKLLDVFDIEYGQKYVFIGLLGAAIYFLLDIVGDSEKTNPRSIKSIVGRIFLAFIMPIMLIVIFTTGGHDESGKAAFSVDTLNLLVFTMGYSYKIVIMLLNKVVEKAEQAIKAI